MALAELSPKRPSLRRRGRALSQPFPPDTRCAFCSRRYVEHDDVSAPGAPTPRCGCLLLKEYFTPYVVSESDARSALRRAGHDVPRDVRYEILLEGTRAIFDSFHGQQGHAVNRYVLPNGADVLATWCPDMKIVWWRPTTVEKKEPSDV